MLKHTEISEKEFELKMRNSIADMPEEVRGRFIAMCLNADQLAQLAKEHDKALREIELKYEKLNAPIYQERAEIVDATRAPTEECVQEFNQRDLKIKDQFYEQIPVNPPDMTEVVDAPGVPGFWFQVLKNHPTTSLNIFDNDIELLKKLINISIKLHEEDEGFQLRFKFEPNEFMNNTEIVKDYFMEEVEA